MREKVREKGRKKGSDRGKQRGQEQNVGWVEGDTEEKGRSKENDA